MKLAREYIDIVVSLGVLLFSLMLGVFVRRVALRRLSAWAATTTWRLDDAFLRSLRRPLVLWFGLAGTYAVSRIARIPPDLRPSVDKVLLSILIMSMTWWAADFTVRLLVLAATREEQPLRVTGVVQNVVRVAVLLLGALVLLATLGISVTPVLTTLGIGGLAVALALQDTLSNLFAGIHVTLARNVRVGDFVKLESGEEGHVEDISWRATRIRMLPNNVVIIPNNRLAQSIVTNYYLPSKDLSVLVQVGVHYASDLEHVERVTCEVARDVMRTVPGGVPDFEPFIRYHTFGESSIDFSVILRAQEFTGGFVVKHEFIKRLAGRYTEEGIVIPFPIRAVNLEQEGSARAFRSPLGGKAAGRPDRGSARADEIDS
jgi:small-conductance mechanosensitive channel